MKINIAETIGAAFEIIAIDNCINKNSISAVYNKGAEMAKYECLCFVHEDVIIHSKGWGGNLLQILVDESIGLVGVSGAVYKSKYAGTWSACDHDLYRTHSIQHFKDGRESEITNNNPGNKEATEVAVIDGVFMSTTKKVFRKYHFDEGLLKGFHGYDIDYSLQVGRKYKVVVTYNILLEHFSAGTLNTDWLNNSLLVHRKWKEELPKSVVNIEKRAKEMSDYLSNQCVINAAFLERQKWSLVISIFFTLILKYFKFNKFKYSRQVMLFLLNKRAK